MTTSRTASSTLTGSLARRAAVAFAVGVMVESSVRMNVLPFVILLAVAQGLTSLASP